MKLVLLKDDKRYGKKGAIIDVSDGFANNFLIPNKIAAPANNDNLNTAHQHNESLKHKAAVELAEAKELAQKINTTTVRVPLKVGEAGKVFGSVTSKEIATELDKSGIELDKKKIELQNPIKTVGQHKVSIRLHKDVKASLLVEVYSA